MHGKTVDPTREESILRLLEVARELAVPRALPDLLAHVINTGRSVLNADRGSVFLYDQGSNELYIITGTGLEALRFSAKQGLAGECATSRQILNIPDCYADARFNQEIDRKTGYRTCCMISVPLIGLEDKLVGVLQLLNAAKGQFDEYDERIALALAGQAAVAIQRQQLLEEQQVKLKLERDLALAREIQQKVLTTLDALPPVDGYDIAVFNRPADDTGGDIYDVVRPVLADGAVNEDTQAPVMLMLADATGHGVGPAISVTQVRAMFRMATRLATDLGEMVKHIDRQVTEDMDGSRFVTAFFGALDPRTHILTYHAPGQGPLLIYRAAQRQCDSFAASGLPLGIMPDIPSDETLPIKLEPGDMLVLLTDGFFECQDRGEQQLGQPRVEQMIDELRDEAALTLITSLVAAVDNHIEGQPQADDLTAVIVKRLR